jgi:hypothetical protein
MVNVGHRHSRRCLVLHTGSRPPLGRTSPGNFDACWWAAGFAGAAGRCRDVMGRCDIA